MSSNDQKNITDKDNKSDVIGKIGAATEIIVEFTKFEPLISNITNALNELIKIVQTAEHNKRILMYYHKELNWRGGISCA